MPAGDTRGDMRGDPRCCAVAKAEHLGPDSVCPQMPEEGGGKGILLSQQVILIRPVSGLQMVSASNLDVGAEY